MCYLFPIWHPDTGIYVRIALLTLICYFWWEEKQAWGLFAPEPISAAGLSAWCQLFQPASWGCSLLSHDFLLLVPLSEHLFTESALTCLFYPLLFPTFSPSRELLQSAGVLGACHFHEQDSSFCPLRSYSDSLKHTCVLHTKPRANPLRICLRNSCWKLSVIPHWREHPFGLLKVKPILLKRIRKTVHDNSGSC